MSLNTRTYDNILLLAEAKCGQEYNNADKIRFNSLINAAAQNAYDSHSFWERFIVFAEPRTVLRNTIAFTEDSYNVFGGGTSEANGLYVRAIDDDIGGLPHYVKYEDNGETVLYHIYTSTVTPGSQWYIDVDTNAGSSLYSTELLSPVQSTPPDSGWRVGNFDTGKSPTPIVQAVSEIETPLDVHLLGQPHGAISSIRKKYLVTSLGIQLLSNQTNQNIAYVTYKKRLSDVYGDGTNGTVSSIPSEWAEYMARYAARDYQIAQRQSNGSPYAIIGSSEVERALEDQLWRLESQNIEETIGRRILTQTSTNNSLY